MSAAEWRAQATQLITTVRAIAPEHTLVVGFHDWNSRAALLASEPFADPNIIYTFHYYDPFVFTHQGATWAGEGFEKIAGVPFPAEKGRKLKVPAEAEGKWPGSLLRSYADDSRESKMVADLKAVRDWSDRHKVPVFAGEFGSFSKNASEADRCRHAAVVYGAFSKFKIPNAWWEWDGGFSMFVADSNRIAPCFATVISDAAKTAGRTETN
jgi:endoglucanase